MIRELNINTEFQELIPPLSLEEQESLEESIIAEGCRDSLIIWGNTIIDGHHRYAICHKNYIPFTTVNKKQELETELDVKLWMINNQFSRRNLPTETRLALAYQFKEFEKEKAKARQGTRNDLIDEDSNIRLPVTLSSITKEESNKALEAIAKVAGVGYSTAFQYDAIQRKGTKEQKAEVASGNSSIKKVYTNIRKAERLETNKVTEWPKGKYRVIYADPPWSYGDERSGGSHGGAVDHYNTMSLQELCDMPVSYLAEKDAVLFMWVTAPMLMNEGNEVLKAWGFKYKAHFIWDKTNSFVGNYNAVQHELLLIATKGSCTPDNTQRFKSILTITKTRKHSEKPEEFRKIIETLYTYGNKIELFARKAIEGWEVYGNEV